MAKGIYVGVEKTGDIITGNLFPTSWNEDVRGTYYSTNTGYVLTASSAYFVSDSVYEVAYVCDGDTSGQYWSSAAPSGATTETIQMDLPNPIKITKMKTYITTINKNQSKGSYFEKAVIKGKKNGGAWIDLYTMTAVQTSFSEISLSNTDYYDSYQIEITTQSNTSIVRPIVYEWQISEYEVPLDTPISVARKVKKAYTGIDNVARKIKKGYIGVSGIARPFYALEQKLVYYGKATDLSMAKSNMAATSVGKNAIFFGGKGSSSGLSGLMDTYTSSLIKGTINIPVPRWGLAATTVGDYALFGGGSSGANSGSPRTEVDAVTSSLVRSTATALSVGRYYLAATTVGDYALFGGGYDDNTRYTTVDTYTSSLVKGTATDLSAKKEDPVATTIGDYALFAGGYGASYFNTVDTYTSALVKGTATNLSVGREELAATTVGNYALFGGGGGSSGLSKIVDTYTKTLTKGTATSLASTKRSLAATTVGDYALFGGGYDGTSGGNAKVDTYTSLLVKGTATDLSAKRQLLAATTVGDYALFGGGKGSSFSAVVNAYQVV